MASPRGGLEPVATDLDGDLDDPFLRRVARSPAIPLPRAPYLSESLLNRYTLIEELGSGGMGTVFAAYDRIRGTRVALKMMTRFEPHALLRFKREFRALAE